MKLVVPPCDDPAVGKRAVLDELLNFDQVSSHRLAVLLDERRARYRHFRSMRIHPVIQFSK